MAGKVTPEMIAEVRRRYLAGEMNLRRIGQSLGVSHELVRQMLLGLGRYVVDDPPPLESLKDYRASYRRANAPTPKPVRTTKSNGLPRGVYRFMDGLYWVFRYGDTSRYFSDQESAVGCAKAFWAEVIDANGQLDRGRARLLIANIPQTQPRQLSSDKASEIRARMATGTPVDELAEEYGVAVGTIYAVNANVIWRDATWQRPYVRRRVMKRSYVSRRHPHSRAATPRAIVRHFAAAMERKLAANDAAKGGWRDTGTFALLGMARTEFNEFVDALHEFINLEDRSLEGQDASEDVLASARLALLHEGADVANMLMFVCDVCGALPPTDERGR